MITHNFIILYHKATQVTIGLQEISYEVVEGDRFVIVCTAVLSGDTAGRTIITAYQTSNDNAIGKSFSGLFQ